MTEYYTEWDRWFAEEHDGTPCEWLICECTLVGDDEPNNVGLCATTPHGHRPPSFETHRVLHRFTASSFIEASRRYNEILGHGPYTPHPDWDAENERWRR